MTLNNLFLSVIFASVAARALAQPTIGAVVNAASYDFNLAPGTLTSVFGTGLAPSKASASSVPLPLQLNGVSVTVNGVACPLSYVSLGQVNVVIPFEAATLDASQTITVPVVLTTSDGSSAPFNVPLSRNAPALFTRNGNGGGLALVFDANLNPASAIGNDPIILYATGLGPTNPPGSADSGGAGSEPLNRVIDTVTVLVGDNPAQVLFAGLAPGLPGVYQINVVPQGPISNRLAVIVNQRQSNVATLPIPVGANVTNVAAAIMNIGIDLIYPSSGRLVTLSEVLFGATYTLTFDFLPSAKPFEIVARYSGGAAIIQETISVDPVAGTYSVSMPVPTSAARQYDFSALGHPVINFQTGQPFPNNVVPFSLFDPVLLDVLMSVPLPNVVGMIGDNGSFQAPPIPLPNLMHFDISKTAVPGFGGFTSITSQHGGSMTAVFELFVDGLVAFSENVTFPVL